MPHQNLDNYLPSQLSGDDVDSCMLAAEKAIAHFESLRARTEAQSYAQRMTVEPQWPHEAISEQSCCEEEEEEEEEDLLKLPYLALKIAFEEAHHHLKQAKQTLKYLEVANAKDKSDEAYQRFVWHRENKFYPILQRYREIRKAYYQAFIARKIIQLKSFIDAIKEIFEWLIIKPIKYMWERIKYFNQPVPKVHYDGVAICIEKEKESRRGDEAFRILYSPLEKMQSGLENQKETTEQAKQVPEVQIFADGIRHRHR